MTKKSKTNNPLQDPAKSSKRIDMADTIKLNLQYVTDNKGNKKSVILDYNEFQELIEDYKDLVAMLEAKNEPPVAWDEMKKQLESDGKV